MNKLAALLLMLIAVILPAGAQQKGKKEDMRRELKEYKMKYIAQEMDLKEGQQKQFFELYEQMWDEKEKLHRDTKSLEKKLNDAENVADDEYRKVSTAITEAKEKEAEIDKKYDEKFSQFLSQKQIFKMKSAEEKFKIKMREMRESHQHKRKDKK